MLEPRGDNPRYQPTMSAVFEETEPESSFKETDKHWKKQKDLRKRKHSQDVPHSISEVDTPTDSNIGFEDRDDDFSDSDEAPADNKHKNDLHSFTFIPGKDPSDNKGHTFLAKSQNNDIDMSKLCSVERIREYLEAELGTDLLK